jgi:uncharacterized BrkB/YihY/UPF0761 family membrane protein
MISVARKMLVDTTLSFIDDEALSRGAAIAFYAITSLAPVVLIVIAVTGLVFGQEGSERDQRAVQASRPPTCCSL